LIAAAPPEKKPLVGAVITVVKPAERHLSS
jgi:hypothetical protein